MNGTHNKNTSCGFDGDLIGYLYEEDSPSDNRRVEEHLRTCGDCSNEFAELSVSRLAVSDWRNTEFNDLVTPRFVLPVVASENTGSKWSLSSIFGGWKLPASALAAAAILVAFGTVYFLQPDFLQPGAPVTETAVQVSPAISSAAVADEPRFSEQAATSPDTGRTSERRIAADTRGVTSANAVRANERIATTAKRQPRSPIVRRGSSLPSDSAVAKRKASAPLLNGFEEKEDETLRLEDLFSEIDAS